jgi:hypothetical protein
MARARQKSAWRHAATIEDELMAPKTMDLKNATNLWCFICPPLQISSAVFFLVLSRPLLPYPPWFYHIRSSTFSLEMRPHPREIVEKHLHVNDEKMADIS